MKKLEVMAKDYSAEPDPIHSNINAPGESSDLEDFDNINKLNKK